MYNASSENWEKEFEKMVNDFGLKIDERIDLYMFILDTVDSHTTFMRKGLINSLEFIKPKVSPRTRKFLSTAQNILLTVQSIHEKHYPHKKSTANSEGSNAKELGQKNNKENI